MSGVVLWIIVVQHATLYVECNDDREVPFGVDSDKPYEFNYLSIKLKPISH